MPSLPRENLQDLVQYGAKVKVEQSVGFVENHVLEVLQGEALGIFQVVE